MFQRKNTNVPPAGRARYDGEIVYRLIVRMPDMPFSSSTSSSPPSEIVLDQSARELKLVYPDGGTFILPCEYLRVFSPSAEVRGHGPGQEVLQVGKRGVNIVGIEPVGHYAVRLVFSDGHDSGLYSWTFLYELGCRKDDNWQDYLARLQAAGASRD